MLANAGVGILIHGAAHCDRARSSRAAARLRCYGVGAAEDLLALARDSSDSPPSRTPERTTTSSALYTSERRGRKAVRHTQQTYSAVVFNVLANLSIRSPAR